MLILNFSYPLTWQQQKQIEDLAGSHIQDIITIPTRINRVEPLEQQITAMVDAIGLSLDAFWSHQNILINPPSYTPAALLLLAELHGRIGHFPSLIRLNPKPGSVTGYEVAELLNLQTIRETARRRR